MGLEKALSGELANLSTEISQHAAVNRTRSAQDRIIAERNLPKRLSGMLSAEGPSGILSAEDVAIKAYERSALANALGSMPPVKREILILGYYGDFSATEVAAIVGISQGAVRTQTARALYELRKRMELET